MALSFAHRMSDLKTSEIREILKLTQKPGVISFAGGLPAPEFFPVREMAVAAAEVLEAEGCKALQYSTTEGDPKLRAQLAARMNEKFGCEVGADNVLITSGSQQGLDLTGKLFLDEGDVVLCESPTYLGAINAFKAYVPRFVEVPTDDEGMLIPELERRIIENDRVKVIYVIPDFQNPTGRTWSLERRRAFMEVVSRHRFPVVEDNPYGELRFEGERLPTLKSMDKHGLVVFLGTFSKILCPGLRIGWLVAERSLLDKYVMVKQGADLHTSTISQMHIAAFIEANDLDANIERVRTEYRARRDAMLRVLDAECPEGVSYTRPSGGLFLWVVLPKRIDARDLLAECIKKNVAFVPGGSFFPNGGNENTCRLNYSNMPCERIEEGVKRLAASIKDFMKVGANRKAEESEVA